MPSTGSERRKTALLIVIIILVVALAAALAAGCIALLTGHTGWDTIVAAGSTFIAAVTTQGVIASVFYVIRSYMP
ncbi:hypothetical protein ACFV3E_00335 [Streptomyces sp. NPDC059718]